MKTVDGLLRAREAQGLTWSLTARLTVIATAAFLAISSLVPLRKDIVAGLCLAGACLTLYGVRLVRRQEHLPSSIPNEGNDTARLAYELGISETESQPIRGKPSSTHPAAGPGLKRERIRRRYSAN